MSEYQRDKGALQVLSTNPSDFEKIALTILKEEGYDVSEINENYKATECLNENFYEEYIVTKKFFVKIINTTINLDIESSFCDIENLGNGLYSFHTMYYNGGTCMSEMISSELDKLF